MEIDTKTQIAFVAGATLCWMFPLLTGLFIGTYLSMIGLRIFIRGPTSGTDIKKRLDGKVVVITGANTGIGKITAHELSKRGAKIIMCCRDMAKANKVADEIKEDTKNEVEVKKLDLSSLESVRSCAKEITEKEEQIDYLINNAGVMMCPEWRTKEGFEMQIGTNHFGHFLLTELLMPAIKRSAADGYNARIINISSMAHLNAKMFWDDINFKKPGSYGPFIAYQQSKLANVLHAKGLAKRLEGTGISVYSLHPGVIATELVRHVKNMYFFLHVLSPLYRFIVKTPFYGAQTTLYCTLEDSIENKSGKYFSDCAEKTPDPAALDLEAQRKLWKISEELVGLN